MPNNNPSGGNGLSPWGGFGEPQIPYGQKQQQDQLQGGAPMAGGPSATSAVNTPRRAGRQAQAAKPGGQPQTGPAGQPQAQLPTPPPLPYGVQVAQAWQAIASAPGAASYPLIQQNAQQAALAASQGH